jgi:site-specific recombinase XerD
MRMNLPATVTALAPVAPRHELARPATETNPAAVYLARLGAGSRRTMAHALGTIAEILTGSRDTAQALPWGAIRYEHAQAIRAKLAERYSPAMANKVLAALRGVLREAWRLGLLDAETYQRAVDLAPIRGSRLPAGRHVGEGEIHAMSLACADGTPAGARDAALLALLAAGGLRRAEVAGLEVADLELETGALRVRGKGSKERIAYLTNGALSAVRAWLEVRGAEVGPLLLPVNKAGRITVRRMTEQAIYNVVQRRAELAGVQSPTPHDFRRTFAGSLLDAGADIAAVQRLMGHANVATTARYDRRGEVAKKAAAGKLHFPYIAPRPKAAERKATKALDVP